MVKVVIMGAGIGGITQACALRKDLDRNHDILVVNDPDRFKFTPSNPWIAVGLRKPEQIVIEMPSLMKKDGIGFDGLAQIPPRNTNGSSAGKWVHLAKVADEKYFLHKVRAARTEPYSEKLVLLMVGAIRLEGR